MNRPSCDLDALEAAARRVAELLADRHPGLSTWNAMLGSAIESLESAVAPMERPPSRASHEALARRDDLAVDASAMIRQVERLRAWKARATFASGDDAHDFANILGMMSLVAESMKQASKT